MRLFTAIDRQNAAVLNICDIYRSARDYGLTHRDILARLDIVWDGLKGCPRHVWEFVRGYERCLFDKLFECDLEYCYEVDGVLYSTWRASHHLTTKVLYDTGHLTLGPGAHYWRGTSKSFN